MSGHLIVDVHDGAWVTVNVGILNYNFDLFRAEICFKGKIEYELNILKVIKYSEQRKREICCFCCTLACLFEYYACKHLP